MLSLFGRYLFEEGTGTDYGFRGNAFRTLQVMIFMLDDVFLENKCV